MYKVIFAYIITLATLTVHAQTVIEGTVLNTDGKAVDAFVTVAKKGAGNILGFVDTDNKGYYKLELNTTADSVTIAVSGMNFGKKVRTVSNHSQKVNFTVKEESLAIQEVIVKAQKIREEGDTINYNVAAYRDQSDRVIGDVLRKMPGIEVSDGGGIKFNGKEIKNFYVENMDLLQNRYGIATNNISAEDVTMVQVMQNHQPIRAMKDLKPSDDVSINLRLRKKAKGSVAITAMLGMGEAEAGQGDRLLMAGELVGMYFGKRQQNMTLYKGNNAGIDVSSEFKQHGSGTGLMYGDTPLSVLAASQPGIAKKRYLQNLSHVISSNHIVKLDSTRNVTVNAVYHEDRQNLWGESVSDYYLVQDGRMSIGETASSIEHIHHLEVSANFQLNQIKTYLNNSMNVDVNWNRTEALGTMTSPHAQTRTVEQNLKSPQLTINNDFYLLRNLGTTSYYVRMKAGYNQKPYTLTCDSLTQNYTARTIAANISSGYGWKWGRFKLDYMLTGDVNLQYVKSELEGLAPLTIPNTNDYWFNHYNIGLEQYMHLDLGSWFFSLNLPLIMETQHLDDRIIGTNSTWNNFFVRPTAEIKYIMGAMWVTLTSSFYRMIDNGGRSGKGLVMHNYRTFQRREMEDASRHHTLNNCLSFYHKNTFRQFFLNGTVSWLHSHNNNVTAINYDGAQTVCNVMPMEHDYDSYRFSGEVNKGFDFWRSTFKFVGNYGLTKTRQLLQQQPTDVRSHYWSVSAYVVTTPLPMFSIAAAYAFGQSRNHVAGSIGGQHVNKSSTRIDMNFFPIERLVLNFAVEDNYNNLTVTDRHCWFGDAKIKFKTKKIDYEIEASNLFNRRVYTRVSYSGLDIYTQTSQLRPRNIIGTIRFKLL